MFLETVEVVAGTGAWLSHERGGGGGRRGSWRRDAAGEELGRSLVCDPVVGSLPALVPAVPAGGGHGAAGVMAASGKGRRGRGDE